MECPKKDLVDLILQQQCYRISSILESIRSVAVIENNPEIEIVALALQLHWQTIFWHIT